MSGGGGSSSDSGGGNDMQVSGAEAFYSSEPGISTAADTRIQQDSFTRASDTYGGNQNDNTPVYQSNYSNQDLETQQEMDAQLGADTSMVGAGVKTYSNREIERGYTDEGQALANVNGKYMTKAEMYSTGIIEKDPETGQDVQGRYKVNPNTGEFEKANKTFGEHWNDAPDSIKLSPVLRLLYASGKNINEWLQARNFKGFNEAGQRGKLGNAALGYGESKYEGLLDINTPEGEREAMNQLAAEAPYLISNLNKPDSVADNFFKNINKNKNELFFQNRYDSAKAKVQGILGTPSPMRYLAVNESPFYNWLKDNSLNKGIL